MSQGGGIVYPELSNCFLIFIIITSDMTSQNAFNLNINTNHHRGIELLKTWNHRRLVGVWFISALI